jgi:hypothetical protein
LSGVSPAAADAVRKVCAFALSAGGTVLLLRVLFRLSQGAQRLGDPELWALLVIASVATLWVRKARPVRATNGTTDRDDRPGDGSPA